MKQFGSTPYRRIGLTVLAVFTLVLLANVVVWFYLDKNTDRNVNLGSGAMRKKWHMLENLASPVDMLILGDSSAAQGVDPEFWTNASGESAINLATIGDATVVNDAWMLETYLERFGRPNKVVIVHAYDIWHRELKQNVVVQLPFKFIWNRLSPYVDASYIRGAVIEWIFPIYFQDVTVPNLIKNPWQRAYDGALPAQSDTGFSAKYTPNPVVVARDTRLHLKFVRTEEFKLSQINAKALQRIVTLADSHGFNVYLANSPLHNKLLLDSSFEEYFSDLKSVVSEFVSKSPHVHLLLDEIVTFDANSMQNTDHVVYDAAQIYTQWLFNKTTGESQP